MRTTLAAVAVVIVMVAAWVHLFAGYHAWATPIVWAVTAVLSALAIATVIAGWRGAGGAQLAIAAIVLAGQVAIVGVTLAGVRLVSFELYPSRVAGGVVLVLCALAAIGIARRRVWARWLGLALGATAIASGGLNTYYYWPHTGGVDLRDVAWSNETITAGWCLLTSALGGLLIAANLAARTARERCAVADGAAAWTADTRLARMVRPMLLTTFGAVPMLLVYALVQPIVPATRPTALVLAVVLAAGAWLAVRGKLVGAIVLGIAGIGLFAQTIATFVGAPSIGVPAYYAVFWLPAAVCAIVCTARLAGPTWRLLRR